LENVANDPYFSAKTAVGAAGADEVADAVEAGLDAGALDVFPPTLAVPVPAGPLLPALLVHDASAATTKTTRTTAPVTRRVPPDCPPDGGGGGKDGVDMAHLRRNQAEVTIYA
jgi:hypothetical protein